MENLILRIKLEEIVLHVEVLPEQQGKTWDSRPPDPLFPGLADYKTHYKVVLQTVSLGARAEAYEAIIEGQRIPLNVKEFHFMRALALKLLRDSEEKRWDRDRGWMSRSELFSTRESGLFKRALLVPTQIRDRTKWFLDESNREIYRLRRKLQAAGLKGKELLEARRGFGETFWRLSTPPQNVTLGIEMPPLDVLMAPSTAEEEKRQRVYQTAMGRLGSQDGPKWIILSELRERECYAYEWAEIAQLLTNPAANLAPPWDEACAWLSPPQGVPRTWGGVCGLFPPPKLTGGALRQWYHWAWERIRKAP